jgi:hypothetical protein
MKNKCEYCGGNGKVIVYESMGDGSGRLAPTGEEECVCQHEERGDYTHSALSSNE